MKTTDDHSTARASKPAATYVAQRTPFEARQDNPMAAAQMRLAGVIDHSPRIVAQRQQIEGAFGTPLQRQGAEEEEPLSARFDPVQRVEEEELMQGRFDPIQRAAMEDEPLQGRRAGGHGDALQREPDSTSGGPGLPASLRAGVEANSGMDMSDVQVHHNSAEPAKVKALAFARGNDIHLGPGQEKHLPHEAWHVVQQRQGRVKPTLQLRQGIPVNDDPSLEHEADVMGARALQQGRAAVADGPAES